MADFDKAISKVLISEGYIAARGRTGYVNDPNDNGGETCAGISRKFWPKEPIWQVVDEHKKLPDFPRNLLTNPNFEDMIKSFYRRNFWNPIKGDDMASQVIAELLVDKAVLEGIRPAVRRAQKLVGLEATGVVDNKLVELLNLLP